MVKILTLLIFLFITMPSYAYELVVIQGVSNSKQTFVIRNTEVGDKKVFEGKVATFTADNVAIHAKAVTVTNEFVQWEIENDFTDVPFKRGDMVTMHDAREYLWALTPEIKKQKYFKRQTYMARRSFEGQIYLSKGISESVAGTDPQNIDRGGVQLEVALKTEITMSFSMAYGISYARDVVNLPEASMINTRFLGIVEGRYYFDPIIQFYGARVSLGLGLGYGQSRTELLSQVTSGNAVLLPATKISMSFPLEFDREFEFVAAFESLRLDEQDADDNDYTTNLINSKFGIIYRVHL